MHKLQTITSIAALAAFPAAASAAPTVSSGFTVQPFATATAGANAPTAISGPDDITYLDGHIFVGWQNGVGTKGEPGPNGPDSTLVEYSRSGSALNSWQPTGKIDGLGANPSTDQVIATVNEDGNSSLYTVNPDRGLAGRVTHYTYSPAPDSASSGGVFTGGGTDGVSVYRREIVLGASNPAPPNATAAFRVRLDRRTHIARLGPAFADNAPARNALTGKKVTLALTDPDSNAVVPGSSSRFAGDFVLDSQADQQLVFADGLHPDGSRLQQLPLTHGGTSAGVDDIRWAEEFGGTLYVVDSTADAVYKVTGPFRAGEGFAALDTVGKASQTTELDELNPWTGERTPLVTGFSGIKGIVWVPPRGDARAGSHAGRG